MAPNILNACLSVVRWAPVVFITAVIVWSYYAYVLEMCLFTIENVGEKVIYLILYHPLLAIFSWSYYKTIFTECAEIPKQFYLSSGDCELFDNAENETAQKELLARLAHNLPVQCRTVSGGIRYCDKCKAIKPDRAHHCSVCGRCILKMDHHCPWVNNCVFFNNYKFFVQFLGYALLYCLYIASTSMQYFIEFWTMIGNSHKNGSMHILFLFFAGCMFSISLVSLLCYHLFLVSKNRSTLESFRAPIFRSGPDKDGFSLGSKSNFIEVFGDEWRNWFLPIFSSFGDGVTYPVRTIDEDYDSLLGQRQRWMEEGGDGDNGPGYDNGGIMSASM